MELPATTTARVIVAALTAVLAALLVWWVYHAMTARPKAEARLGKNTTEAAVANGQDAVNSLGKAQDREAAEADLSRANEKDIRNAEGSNAPVAAPARDAGLASLCRRAAYRGDPKCVQHANP